MIRSVSSEVAIKYVLCDCQSMVRIRCNHEITLYTREQPYVTHDTSNSLLAADNAISQILIDFAITINTVAFKITDRNCLGN